MRFYYVYKALAHPEHNGYVTPFTLEERLMHVREAERTLGSEIAWVCDTMENDLKHALGDAPNSEFVIDPEGRIARKRAWSDPEQLRADLEELVGPVEHPTGAAEVKLAVQPPPKVAVEGVVKRIPRSRAMKALKTEPQFQEGQQPFYVKLRAEADETLLRTGSGKLYLGFHLDPLYHVHWNNLAKPIRVEIVPPGGLKVTPVLLEGPKLEVPADIDPREFLVDVDAGMQWEPLKLIVSYFACNDDEGWCKAVRQEYLVRLEIDPDGGWVRSGAGRPAAGRGRRPGGPPGARIIAGRIVEVHGERRTLTVRTAGGEEREFVVPGDAILMRDRRPVKLGEIESGESVRLQFVPAEEDEPASIVRMRVGSDEPR